MCRFLYIRFIFEGLIITGGGGGGGVLILVDVENWLDNVRMYNGYLKINKKKK